jgi:hypothetical protein
MSAVEKSQNQPIPEEAECFRPKNASASWPANIRDVLEILDRLAALSLKPIGGDQTVPFLDRMLTTEECARWMRMDPITLHRLVKQDVVPAIVANEKETRFRFHPRTIIEHGTAAFMRRKARKR